MKSLFKPPLLHVLDIQYLKKKWLHWKEKVCILFETIERSFHLPKAIITTWNNQCTISIKMNLSKRYRVKALVCLLVIYLLEINLLFIFLKVEVLAAIKLMWICYTQPYQVTCFIKPPPLSILHLGSDGVNSLYSVAFLSNWFQLYSW